MEANESWRGKSDIYFEEAQANTVECHENGKDAQDNQEGAKKEICQIPFRPVLHPLSGRFPRLVVSVIVRAIDAFEAAGCVAMKILLYPFL